MIIGLRSEEKFVINGRGICRCTHPQLVGPPIADDPIPALNERRCKNSCCVGIDPRDIRAAFYGFEWNGRRESCFKPSDLAKLQQAQMALNILQQH